MAARATWKGVLQISRVRIPIKAYPATESSETISFNQLHEPCQTRVTQRRWCTTCAREVASAEIVKGFEFEKGKYVLLLEAELEAVQPPSTQVIDLTQFAEVAALEPRLIDRAYYLAPDGPDTGAAAAAYAICCEAMAGRVGIGTLAIYGREYLIAVGPRQGALLLYTLHHAAELREPPYTAPAHALKDTFSLKSAEVTLAQRVILALTRPLTLEGFVDQYQTDLRRLIDAKIAGHEIVVPPAIEPGPVLSLTDALTESLALVTPAKGAAPVKRTRAS